MVTGSPGGSRIITIVLETMLGSLVYGMNAQQAVDAPRTHMQWLPDRLEYEPGALSERNAGALRAMGDSLLEIPSVGIRASGDRRSPYGLALWRERPPPPEWRSHRVLTAFPLDFATRFRPVSACIVLVCRR
jgi:Gamma-glutamyltranspeptidase